MKKINNNVIGIFLGIISTFFYTLMDTTIKIASSKSVITHDVLFFQSSSLMLIILFMVGVLKYGIKFFYIKASVLIMFIRGVVSFINFYLAFYIVTILHLDIYYSIVFIAPSIAAVLASIFLKEHFNIYKISALFIGLLGVLIITNPFGQSFDVSLVPAIIITVILSIFFALSGLLTRKYLKDENSWTVAFYSIGVCVFFAFIFSSYNNGLGMTLSLGSSIKYIMPTALFCLLGMLLFIKAYQVAQVQLVAPTEYFSLVWGIIVGLLLFSRVPEISVIIGAIVVIASNFISGIKK